MPKYRRRRHRLRESLASSGWAVLYAVIVGGGLALFLFALGEFSGDEPRLGQRAEAGGGVEIVADE